MARLSVVALLLLLGPACGYRLSVRSSALPEGVRSVCAPVFRNDSAEPALEVLFTQAFRQELVRTGTLGAEGACEARLEGVVASFSSAPFLPAEPSFSPELQSVLPPAASYRATASVVLRLVREGRVLSEVTVAGAEDFVPSRGQVTGEVLELEAQRQTALHRLAEGMMREGYERLAGGW